MEVEDLFCYQEGAMLSWMDEEDDMLGLKVDSKTLQEWHCPAHVSGRNLGFWRLIGIPNFAVEI